MPTYTFRNEKTDETFDDFMSMDDREKYLKKNPHIKTVITSVAFIGSTTGDRVKPDNGFKEVLNKVADNHPNSALANRYSKKSIKQVKTEAVVNKHRKNFITRSD